MTPLAFDVAVVIPVRDGARHLAEALDSVARQTLAPREVVVVDDGSTDGSADVARATSPGARVVAQAALGAGSARNRGVAETTAPWIAFLDADDRWRPGKLELQRDAIAVTPGAVAAIGSLRQFFSPELGRTGAPDPEVLAGTSPTALVVRRDALLATGGFSTDPNAPEAAEWWIRFQSGGPVVAVVSDVVADRRIHGANTGTRRPAMRQGYLRLAKEALERRRARGGPR